MPAGIVSGAAFARGVETLRANGFNLLAVFDCAALPERIGSAIAGFDFDPAGYERLVVLGNGGGQFWDSLTRSVGTVSSLESDHPVDQFSRFNVENTVRDHWGDGDFRILYPGEPGVPLQQLGRLAGWHHDSPLGIGIHRAYGPWFAYRAAFLIDASLPLSNEPDTDSPCDACPNRDCVGACPAGAVRNSQAIDMDVCMDFSVAENSPCATACPAREACPVSAHARYSRAQITYHYGRANAAIKKYRNVGTSE